ncbi:glycosyl hydrolase family 18 protein [Streptomyces monticola]|uniref:Glycosyl hydrolase family 18 protein n=1 Tax=Streptomyces monticola TaxID=2666263 RepID=A0ABW2JUD6_9ACTN
MARRRTAHRTHARALGMIGAAALALTALAPAHATDRQKGPDDTAAPRPARTVSGWLPYWEQEAAYRTALRHKDQLHTVSPFWYEAKSAGRIAAHGGAGERRVIDGLHRAGIKVVPTVHEQLGPGVLARIMTRKQSRAAHIRALVAVVRSRAYDGIDIDYESIASTGNATYKQVRAGYATFIDQLCRTLHAMNKQCVATVSPQARGNGRIWDYRRIGAAADRMRIMAYNMHWEGGPPGPLSSPDWYDDILRRATALVPRHKLEMALPGYGWDWPVGGKGRDKAETRHVTSKSAERLRRKVGAKYRLDPASRTPYFHYKDGKVRRTVWYQDARGTAAHLPVLRKYGVRNTALWALNFEDPQLWPALAKG